MKDKGLFMTAALLVCCYGLVSCYNEIDNQLNENPQSEVSTSPYHITITQALDKMFATMDVLSPTTRADEKTIRNIQTVTSADTLQQTRSIDGEEPTDAYYIVNFENDEGFAILAADARFGCDVIAIAERGNLNYRPNIDSRSIDPSQEDTAEHEFAGDTLTLEDLYIAEDDDYLLGGIDPDGLITSLTNDMYQEKRRDPFILDDGIFTGGGGSTPSYTYRTETRKEGQIGPLLTTEWNQRAPFNDMCPHRYYYNSPLLGLKLNIKEAYDYDTTKIENYLYKEATTAGCIAIAVEQILAYHEYPSTQSILGVNDEEQITSWETLKGLTDPQYTTSTVKNHIARITRTIGDGCNMWYGCFGGTQSFATPQAAKKYLSQIGYQNTHRHIGYSLSTTKDALNNDCPPLIGALAGLNKGHAWVIDGYFRLVTEKICENKNGAIVSTTIEYENDYVHCNWGWKGRCNGWFLSGLFKTANPLEYDTPDAPNTPDSLKYNSMDRNYSSWRRMVTYDKPSI